MHNIVLRFRQKNAISKIEVVWLLLKIHTNNLGFNEEAKCWSVYKHKSYWIVWVQHFGAGCNATVEIFFFVADKRLQERYIFLPILD